MRLRTKIILGFFFLLTIFILPTFIVVGTDDQDPEVELFLLANDVHVGLVLPLKNEDVNWSEFLDFSEFETLGEWFQLGWGDRTFYFEVPQWEDLTLPKAIDALLLPGEPVIHVDFLRSHPISLGSYSLKISRKNYRALAQVIRERFVTQDKGPVKIPNKSYGSTDNFYEAHGTYSLLRTCNNWTAELLASQGLRRPLWSPMKYGLIFAYQ